MLKRYKFYIIIAFFLLMYSTLSTYMAGENLKFKFDDVYNLNENWNYTSEANDIESTKLPNYIKIPKNQEYQIERPLPENFKLPQALMIRSSMQDIKLYIDDQLLFTNSTLKGDSYFNIPRLSVWHIINIPEDSHKKILKIRVSTPIESMSGRINEITYGQSSNLIANIIFKKMPIIIISFTILLVGFFVWLTSFTLNKDNDKRLQYLSVFFISISLWIISETDIMQLFSSNLYFISSVSYLMLPISAISFTLFVRDVALKKYTKILLVFNYIYTMYIALSMVMQLIADIAYIESLKFFILILLFEIILIIVLLTYESLWHKDKNSIKYLCITFILIITAIIETTSFLSDNFMNVSNLSSYGMALFLVLLAIDTLNYISLAFQKEGEALYLQDVAYKDALTGGFNRAAFERDIDLILNAKVNKPFRLTIFDLNDFKKINDLYGHSTGDEVLRSFNKILAESFLNSSKCYRIGGDEFMIISNDISEFKHEESINLMDMNIYEYNKYKEYSVKASYGSGIYYFDKSFGTFKNEVDSQMYIQKKNSKLII